MDYFTYFISIHFLELSISLYLGLLGIFENSDGYWDDHNIVLLRKKKKGFEEVYFHERF